jgi:hypothetical protein
METLKHHSEGISTTVEYPANKSTAVNSDTELLTASGTNLKGKK